MVSADSMQRQDWVPELTALAMLPTDNAINPYVSIRQSLGAFNSPPNRLHSALKAPAIACEQRGPRAASDLSICAHAFTATSPRALNPRIVMATTSAGSTPDKRRAGSAERQAEPSPLVLELNRLRNELNFKTQELGKQALEINTLARQLKAAEQGAQSSSQQLEATRDRLLSAQKEAESSKRQLTAAQHELDELRRQAEASARGVMKALDKESAALHGQLEAAEAGSLRARDLESEVRGLRRQLAAANEEVATLQVRVCATLHCSWASHATRPSGARARRPASCPWP